MAIITEWIRYDDRLSFRAQPEKITGPLPAVIVLQEAFGIDGHIEDVTRRFAAAGYVALAPDLFAEGGERPPALARERLAEVVSWANGQPATIWMDLQARAAALAGEPADRAARLGESIAAAMAGAVASQQFLPHAVDAARYLRTRDPVAAGQPVAVVGFCMGGALAGRLACADAELAAAIVFYGLAPPAELVAQGRCPVLGLYGQEDPRIVATVPGFAEAMAAAGRRYESVLYPGTPHAFFNDGRAGYRPAAARDAFVRALVWLRDHLAVSSNPWAGHAATQG